MSTRIDIEQALCGVSFPGYTFRLEVGERTYLQATFFATCAKTGEREVQFTRKWYISHEATVSEVVQTALKLVLTSVEHEARESFKYCGHAIFGPHLSVEKLLQLHLDGIACDEREAA
jgi:hypothetical protein